PNHPLKLGIFVDSLYTMKNLVLAVLSTVFFTTSFAQKSTSENKFPFKIEGTIRNFNGKKIYVHHKWDDKDYTDSAKVNNGKFLFNLRSAEPNMYWFTTTNNINEQPNFVFFADAVTHKATLIGDSLAFS